jgi:hypothetical protein
MVAASVVPDPRRRSVATGGTVAGRRQQRIEYDYENDYEARVRARARVRLRLTITITMREASWITIAVAHRIHVLNKACAHRNRNRES